MDAGELRRVLHVAAAREERLVAAIDSCHLLLRVFVDEPLQRRRSYDGAGFPILNASLAPPTAYFVLGIR
jgi:hypothetical protein